MLGVGPVPVLVAQSLAEIVSLFHDNEDQESVEQVGDEQFSRDRVEGIKPFVASMNSRPEIGQD